MYYNHTSTCGRQNSMVGIITAIILSAIYLLIFKIYFFIKKKRKRPWSEKSATRRSIDKFTLPAASSSTYTNITETAIELTVELRELLHSGSTSEIFVAGIRILADGSNITKVAVKLIKDNIPESLTDNFNEAIRIRKMIEPHPHIVQLVGFLNKSDPINIVLEYMARGSLKQYLRKMVATVRHKLYKRYSSNVKTEFFKFAQDIALGMSYLSRKKILHRAICARNILISENWVCKITDFGNSMILGDRRRSSRSNDLLPIRWQAPEAILNNNYSLESEVWSFGILLWEIVTLGATPYPQFVEPGEVIHALEHGYRMTKPEHCKDEVFYTIDLCWREHPEMRPSFVEILIELKKLSAKENKYLDLNKYDSALYESMDFIK